MSVSKFIFAFYLFALAIYPCSDASFELHKESNEVASITQTHMPTESQSQDGCTPFCICACCAAHIKLTVLQQLDFSGIVHNTNVNIPYMEKNLGSGNTSIWQPPRI